MKEFLMIFAATMICLGLVKLAYVLLLKFRKGKEK